MLNSKDLNRKRCPTGALSALLSLALGGGLLVSTSAEAIEYSLTAGFSTERSDNITRSQIEEDDWIHTPMLTAELAHQTANLRVEGDYLVEHRIYTEDFFDDRTRWTGRADLQWDALNFLQFNASNSRTESTEDALQQDVENNRQITTVTSAGPKLQFRPRTSDILSLEYRFADITQEETDSDSERQLIAVAYELGLSENRALTLEVSRDMVDFDRDTSPELDIDTASLTYSSEGDAIEVDARGGYTTIDRSLNRDEVDGVIGSLDVTWSIGGGSQLEINASRSINDQSDDVLRGSAEFGQGSVFQNTDVNEVFTEDNLNVTYSYGWGRNTASIGYQLQDQDFEDIAESEFESRDQDESGFNVSYARRVTPRVDLRMGARFLERDFQDRGLTEDFITADLRIDWQAGRRVNLFAGASYEEREGSGADALVAALSFDEFRFSFGLTIDIIDRTKLPQQR